MPLNLLVYDPPFPGMPHLAVALETDEPAGIVYVEPHGSLAAAEDAILKLARRMQAATPAAEVELPIPSGAESTQVLTPPDGSPARALGK